MGITICSVINVTGAYIAMSANIVGKMYLTVPWTTPAPLAAFLSTMDWKAVVLWFILFAIDVVIMKIFISLYDKQLCQQEAESTEEV